MTALNTLRQGMAWLTEESRMLAGMVVAFGRRDQHQTAFAHYGPETLFDLASLTKMFTMLSVMKLKEQGKLRLSDTVGAYAPMFPHLKDLTLADIAAFTHRLVTPGRVDSADSREEGLSRLFQAEAQPHTSGRVYSDIHAMVLKYVIEGACGQTYADYLSSWLLKPLGLSRLYAQVPENERIHCASCDGEHRIEGDRFICRRGILPGTPHDPKAQLLSPHGEDLCGHAGLFASLPDLVTLCQALLSGEVLRPDSLREMAVRRQGRPLAEGYSQYLGYQCFVKHPDQRHSEVPPYMGQQAISWSGFTGHHLSIDIEHNCFCILLGNRVKNRLTVLVPPPGKTLADYGLNPDGSGRFSWPDGERIYSSVNYVYQKDARLHAPIGEMLREMGG